MKFSCEKSLLIEALHLTSKAVSSKSSLEILEGILFNITDTLELTGYDLSMAIKTNLDVDIIEKGSIVINARLINDIIKKLPDDTIFIEVLENNIINIKCDKAVFNISGIDSEDYPDIPQLNEENKIEINHEILKNMINKTIFAVSKNESKPIHTGCLFNINNDDIEIVAVDGYRLAINKNKLETSACKEIKFVIPEKVLKEIANINKDITTHIYPNEKNVLIKIDNITIISRIIEGNFLNYSNAIPVQEGLKLKINRREFINSVDRVSLIINERFKNPINIKLHENNLELSVLTAIGKSYDECPFIGEFNELEIGFNSRYVLDALNACDDEEIYIIFKNNLDPMLIKPIDNDEYLFLILPVRISNEQN